jgi:hypothetical protein
MRTAFMAGALMALVLGSSNAHAKKTCPPGSSAATKKGAASINLANFAKRKEYAGLRQSVIICSARA